MVQKKQGNRKPVFEEKHELGTVAMRCGFRTVKSLAVAVQANHKTVTRVFRGEIKAPFLEKRLADALGITVLRMRKLCAVKKGAPVRELPLAA